MASDYYDELDLGLLKWLKSLKLRNSPQDIKTDDIEGGAGETNSTSPAVEDSTRSTNTSTSIDGERVSAQYWNSSPNLQLNIATEEVSTQRRSIELCLAALAAIILQASLLVIAGVVSYRVPGHRPQPWGLPCYVSGSVLLFIGMLSCSVAIEKSTVESKWRPQVPNSVASSTNGPQAVNGSMSVFWIQRTQRVSDQDFGSYVMCAPQRAFISTSSRREDVNSHGVNDITKADKWQSNILAIIAILAGGLGFTIQFIGLRGLSWPCAVSQLCAIILMAMIRALIRRRLGETPRHCDVQPGFELEFLAIQLVESKYRMFQPSSEKVEAPQSGWIWRVDTANEGDTGTYPFHFPSCRDSSSDTANKAQQIVFVRKRLGDLCQWMTSASKPALALARSIERFMDEFLPSGLPDEKPSEILWQVPLRCSTTECMNIDLSITKKTTKESSGWVVEVGEVEAILSLWMAYLEETNTARARNDKEHQWQRSKAGVDSRINYCRILGPNDQHGTLQRDINWWVRNPTVTEVIVDREPNTGENGMKELPHSYAGFEHKDMNVVIGFTGASKGITPQSLLSFRHLMTYVYQSICFI